MKSDFSIKKICLIDNSSSSLIKFRGNFIIELLNIFDVYVIAPFNQMDKEYLLNLGVKSCIDIPDFKRKNINPLFEYKLYKFYKKNLKIINPQVCINYTIKCAIWGSLAADKCGVINIYSMLPGLGYIFTESGKFNIKKFVLSFIVGLLYKFSLAKNKVVFFLNKDDKNFFLKKKYVNLNIATVINGEGIDLDYFHSSSFYPNIVTFLFVGRLLKDKGVCEYIKAAKILKDKYQNNVKFILIGSLDSNPKSLSKKELILIKNNKNIDYLEHTQDVRPYILNSSVFVLPSYREGMPISVLESMSMSRPIITTDVSGCRDAIINEKNGYLVSPRCVKSLIKVMEIFVNNKILIEQMGTLSRQIAEEKYNVHKINKEILNNIVVDYI